MKQTIVNIAVAIGVAVVFAVGGFFLGRRAVWSAWQSERASLQARIEKMEKELAGLKDQRRKQVAQARALREKARPRTTRPTGTSPFGPFGGMSRPSSGPARPVGSATRPARGRPPGFPASRPVSWSKPAMPPAPAR